jgi:hypothetical protein
MAFIKRGPLTQVFDEVRRLQFQQAVHEGVDLGFAVDILVALARGRTRSELMSDIMITGTNAGMTRQQTRELPYSRTLNFLFEQRLIEILKTKRHGEAVYKATRNALQDLIYRLEHEGEPLPPVWHDPDAKRRRLAHEQIGEALDRGGWRGKGRSRLRVIE